MKYKKNYFICIFSIIVLCIFTITSCGDPTSTLRVYNLTILTDGNGTTDPTGTIEVNNNESTDISAIPNQDYFFDNWEVVSGSGVEFGDDEEADTTVTLTKEDATIRVNFRETVYDVEIDNEYIDENNDTALSFTYVDAEVGGTYHYSIDDQGNAGSVPVTGEGPVNFVTETILMYLHLMMEPWI